MNKLWVQLALAFSLVTVVGVALVALLAIAATYYHPALNRSTAASASFSARSNKEA